MRSVGIRQGESSLVEGAAPASCGDYSVGDRVSHLIHLVGLICVNHDVEDILVLSEHLSNLLHSFSLPQEEESSAYTENLDDSIPELSSNLIHSTILGYGIPSEAMHTADKLEILRSLEAQGVFQTKGSVGQVARELHISEPTVYRYLRRIRSEAT